MTANLWAEADLVNGGCRRIVNLRIVKPVDGRRSRTQLDFPGYRDPLCCLNIPPWPQSLKCGVAT